MEHLKFDRLGGDMKILRISLILFLSQIFVVSKIFLMIPNEVKETIVSLTEKTLTEKTLAEGNLKDYDKLYNALMKLTQEQLEELLEGCKLTGDLAQDRQIKFLIFMMIKHQKILNRFMLEKQPGAMGILVKIAPKFMVAQFLSYMIYGKKSYFWFFSKTALVDLLLPFLPLIWQKMRGMYPLKKEEKITEIIQFDTDEPEGNIV